MPNVKSLLANASREDMFPTATASAIMEHPSSEDDITPPNSVLGETGSRSSSHGSEDGPQVDHVVHLSNIEHCMPRAYIRICLAYRVPSQQHLKTALNGLQEFVAKTVEAKPYLAGDVIDVESPGEHTGRAEIRFTTKDYLTYPKVEVQHLYNEDGTPILYDDLDVAGLPPSRLRPEDVSALPPNADPKKKSPVLRVRANVVQGGLIVSIYLHHCVSDGTGFDLITSGDVREDGLTFRRPSGPGNRGFVGLEAELKQFAERKSAIRQSLSKVPPGLSRTRKIKARQLNAPAPLTNKPGRGCVLMICAKKISALVAEFNHCEQFKSAHQHTVNSVIMALLWRHMTRARRPSIQHNTDVKTSKLLIPCNIRERMNPPLHDCYFGAAVDSGKAELDLDSLTDLSVRRLDEISHMVRQAIVRVDDAYVRQMIDFVHNADANIDVQDIQASNMDRVRGADMYITSWLKLRSYQHDLGMGLGGPDWVRKPWSRDPGSCIILPQKFTDPDYYEVVAQMTEADMRRLLEDQEFMKYILRVID